VFLREGWSTSVEVRDGTVENVISRGERGIGVRVLRDGRAGFAYTSDLTRDGIAACVDAARDMSVVTEPDPHLRLADVPLTPVDLGLVDQDEERSVAERTEVALAVERAARAADPRITAFRKTTYGDGVTTNILANTGGVRGAYRAAYYSVGTSAVATDGEERQIGSHSQASRRFADLDTEATGRRAAQLATAKLGARAIPTQRLAVVLDPYMGMALLGTIAPLFSADSVLKGKSLFASKIGEQVANEQVTIGRRRPRAGRPAQLAVRRRGGRDDDPYAARSGRAPRLPLVAQDRKQDGHRAHRERPPWLIRAARPDRRREFPDRGRRRRSRGDGRQPRPRRSGSPRSSTSTPSIRSPGSSRSAPPATISSAGRASTRCRASPSPATSRRCSPR